MNPWWVVSSAGLGFLLCASCGARSNVRPLSAGSPAERYLAEFIELENTYPGEHREGARAPGGAQVVLKPAKESLSVFDSCHSVWLENSGGVPHRILQVREGYPGSGSSLEFGWSSDGNAVFIAAYHSGIDCPWSRNGHRLRIIYTLADGIAWQLPDQPSNNPIKLSVRPVTPLAVASGAPARPAAYRVR